MPCIAHCTAEDFVDAVELRKYLALASRFNLRKLMAECLPYAMHHVFHRKSVADVMPHLDPTVCEVFFGKMVSLSSTSSSR